MLATYESKAEELLRLENWQLKQFAKLGLSLYEATDAVDRKIDYHDVERFLEENPSCSPQMACKIVAP